jgi:dTDP-4-dehydrorhamnose 3,5-epimerase
MPFEFRELSIPGVVLVTPKAFPDDRGFFVELYKHSDFMKAGIGEHFVQDNYSRSIKGTLRGLHFQKHPKAQGKLVRCVRGTIYDVVVDLQRQSPTFGRWIGVELSEESGTMLYIPPAFAHGFLVLSDTADVLYKCTEEYSPSHDRGILWNDPALAIPWPNREPLLSSKDRGLPLLSDTDFAF